MRNCKRENAVYALSEPAFSWVLEEDSPVSPLLSWWWHRKPSDQQEGLPWPQHLTCLVTGIRDQQTTSSVAAWCPRPLQTTELKQRFPIFLTPCFLPHGFLLKTLNTEFRTSLGPWIPAGSISGCPYKERVSVLRRLDPWCHHSPTQAICCCLDFPMINVLPLTIEFELPTKPGDA